MPVQGRFHDDCYEVEVEVAGPLATVWDALQQPSARRDQPAWLSAWPCLPGFETTGAVTHVEPRRCITVHKHSEPCRDTEIALTLEERPGGTALRVVQSKVPAWVLGAVEVFVRGGDQIVADLLLYLERGVEMSRHSILGAFPGMVLREVPTGLEVTSVLPGTFADRLGLKAGDLLLTVGGAPVFTQACLLAVMRVLEAGAKVEATWVTGRDLRSATAAL